MPVIDKKNQDDVSLQNGNKFSLSIQKSKGNSSKNDIELKI